MKLYNFFYEDHSGLKTDFKLFIQVFLPYTGIFCLEVEKFLGGVSKTPHLLL